VIKTVWIDNPPVNVLGAEVLASLAAELAAIDDGTRVVVLRGRGGRAFSAGGDIGSFQEGGPGQASAIQGVANLIEATPVPVVAAIDGYCLGGGLELALACDIRIAHTNTQFGFPEVGLGLIPGGGGTQRAPRLIGPGRARWLLLSGERISAARALEWGLVELVTDDVEAGAAQAAGTLAAQSPHALRELKILLHETRAERSDERELESFARCLASDEGQEGIAAFLEKRAPAWRGPELS
jgi:enoyl-CoA hydratase/3-hydroxyacyl-CoA dehydrogenase